MGRGGGGGWRFGGDLGLEVRGGRGRLPQEGPCEAVGRRAGRLRSQDFDLGAARWGSQTADARWTIKGFAGNRIDRSGACSLWDEPADWDDSATGTPDSPCCATGDHRRKAIRKSRLVRFQGPGRQDIRGGKNETPSGQCSCLSGRREERPLRGSTRDNSSVAIWLCQSGACCCAGARDMEITGVSALGVWRLETAATWH